MSAGALAALITAATALVGAVSTFMAQLGHINWHKNNPSAPAEMPSPAPGDSVKP